MVLIWEVGGIGRGIVHVSFGGIVRVLKEKMKIVQVRTSASIAPGPCRSLASWTGGAATVWTKRWHIEVSAYRHQAICSLTSGLGFWALRAFITNVTFAGDALNHACHEPPPLPPPSLPPTCLDSSPKVCQPTSCRRQLLHLRSLFPKVLGEDCASKLMLRTLPKSLASRSARAERAGPTSLPGTTCTMWTGWHMDGLKPARRNTEIAGLGLRPQSKQRSKRNMRQLLVHPRRLHRVHKA